MGDRPLRVAMVGLRAPWGAEGGVERAIGQLAPKLVERGCAVTVYCRRRYNPLGQGFHQGVRLIDIDTVYSKHLEAIVHTAVAAPRAAVNHDVVHFHATGPALMSWAPRLLGRKTVVTVHGLDWKRAKWGALARGALRTGGWCAANFPDRSIVVGAHLSEHFRQAVHVPNGVETLQHVPLSQAHVPGLKPRQFYLFVGRLVPEKGIEVLLDAARRAGTPLPLIIVGSAPYEGEYQAHLQRLAPEGVQFVGPRFGRERDALLSNARAFFSPSSIEGFPIAPLEAMSAELPVGLSDIPPHREVLGDSGAGLIVPDDAHAWADAFHTFADYKPGQLREMGQRGRARVKTRYSWDEVADQTMAVYEDALES